MQKILNELQRLHEAGLISADQIAAIEQYYAEKKPDSPNRLLLIFGVLGALLIGLGVILIIAHNWDELGRTTKTILAFIPMLIGQGLVAYTLRKQPDSIAWREASATFLILAVGACISLVSQIYHILGSMEDFMLTWVILSAPLIYVLRSSMASLLYLIGISWYVFEAGYGYYDDHTASWIYLILLAVALPHYYQLYQKDEGNNYLSFHHWMVPVSLLIALGTFTQEDGEWFFLGYFSLLGGFYLLGQNLLSHSQRGVRNGYLIIGSVGMISMLLLFTFHDFWDEIRSVDWATMFQAPEFYVSLFVTALAAGLHYGLWRSGQIEQRNPMSWAYVLFVPLFFVGLSVPRIGMLVTNIVVFLIGLFHIRLGVQRDHLGILNFGLLIITALVLCRFFDTEISFVIRGLLFVLVGAGFIYANYRLLQRRKHQN